jgi:hypothetical protein
MQRKLLMQIESALLAVQSTAKTITTFDSGFADVTADTWRIVSAILPFMS